ncbi:MAG: endonuclease III domain-containing protein [Desulfuromonadales bacterium]
MQNRLILIFEHLAGHFGPLHWWPADTPFEVAVGAVLTQNTSWINVEKAIANLRDAETLTPKAIRELPRSELEALIRPSGFFRQKAERLHLFVDHLFAHHDGSISRLLDAPLAEARKELLSLKGIGPESADSILLYAGGHPSFVVDAYTRRLFGRLGLLEGNEWHETIRYLFMDHLPPDAELFNEYHALIVEQCKTFCRKRRPHCDPCPLLENCPTGLEENAKSK